MAAVQAARLGFGRFILADGDRVELSNLNRQQFLRAHLGRNKAEVLAEIIRDINPRAEVQVIDRFLRRNDFEPSLAACDFAVNTVDWDGHAFVHMNRSARDLKRTVVFPLNIGWASALTVLGPEVDPQVEPTRWLLHDDESPLAIKRKLILKVVGPDMPAYLRRMLNAFLNDNAGSWPYDPQLATTTAVTSALIVRTLTALVAGEKVPHAPEFVYVDFAGLQTFVEPLNRS